MPWAALLARSAGEILLRLFLGMPADLSWRASHRGAVVRVANERSPSMGARVIGALAVIGGACWGTLLFFTIFATPTDWTVVTPMADTALMLAGGMGLTVGIIGPRGSTRMRFARRRVSRPRPAAWGP